MISGIIFEVNIVAEQKQAQLVTIFFVTFALLSTLLLPRPQPYRCSPSLCRKYRVFHNC